MMPPIVHLVYTWSPYFVRNRSNSFRFSPVKSFGRFNTSFTNHYWSLTLPARPGLISML